MKILHKYVLKEHLGPLTFALTTLTSLLLLNYIAKQFGNLVGKGIPWTVILEFFGLSVPFTLALTFPMAVLVATLYAFGRLGAENEITALKASGLSLRRILAPVLWAAAGVTVFMVIFNDQIMTRANHRLATLQSDIFAKKPTVSLSEQILNEVQPGKFYLRASKIDEGSNRMSQVTIFDLSDVSKRRTIYADSGTLAMSKNQADLLLTLFNGTMQDVPSQAPEQLQRLYFDVDHVAVKGVGNQFQENKTDNQKGEREMSVCEMSAVVNQSWTTYASARREYKQTIARVRSAKLKLSKKALEFPDYGRPSFMLGDAYCKLTRKLGVPALGAQEAPKPVVVPRQAQAPAVKIIPLKPAPTSRPSVPAPTIQHPPGMDSAQIADVTPSIMEMQKMQMNEALDTIAKYDIEIHKKFALAVACFVFVLLGAPIALRFPRGGVGLTIGVSLFVFALYYVGLIAGASLAENRIIPAWISMWGANVIFAVAALWLLRGMGKEGSTARGGDAAEMWETIVRKFLPERRVSRVRRPQGDVA